MKIPYIRFEADRDRPQEGFLDISGPDELKNMTETNPPQVLLITRQNMDGLKVFQDDIQDKGKKNIHKGLAFYLLGLSQGKTPMLYAEFTGRLRLENSIQTFLNRAKTGKEFKTFIIGISEERFDELEKKYFQKISPEVKDQEATPATAVDCATDHSVPETPSLKDGDDPSDMLDFTVPKELQQTYLGNSPEFQRVRKMIMAAATSSDPIPVLILGPSGTGKEKVARAIHENSKRKGGPFRAVNCGAISAELMESELFGHLKGAFSGAFRGKIGMWEAADKGTLFLDEIGDLLPEHQVKILRALQEKKIRPVGATEELSVDVRIITATNRDLFFMVKEGQFRDDLYYRLRGVLIRTPAIRDTPEEIPAMADTFWKVITKDSNAALSDSIKQQLKSYPWPGNIRHLKSVLRQLHALFPRKTIEPRHLNYIMTMDDPTHCVAKPRSEDNNVKPQLTKCLRHLRRVDEAVNATMAMIGPCLKSKRMDREKLAYIKKEIRYHIEEMELLFNDPLLFGTHETFTSVYHLKGKLTFFNSLLAQGYGPAQEYWQKEVKEDFSHVLNDIFKAFETVQDQA